MAQYSTKPGVPPDSNGDRLPDERSYAGLTADATVSTPAGALQKAVKPGELTYGAILVYRMVVPAQSINATLYNVVITDVVDSRLQVVSVDNGTNSGNQVSAAFAAIGPHQQKVVTITVTLPADSAAAPGTLVRNGAYVRYDNGGVKRSNEVTNRIVVPALTVDKTAAQIEVNTGDLVDYTIRVRNVGNGRAQQVQLTDSLPGGFSFVAGSGMLNGGPLADLAGDTWLLPDLVGGAEHVVTFQARADQAEAGKLYTNTAAAHATNSYGRPIPSDSSARVPADTDPDDTAGALVYGPLVWEQDSTYVAFEDLKSAGWCDWDYNDFIVKINLAKGLTPAGNLAALKVNYEPIAHGGAFDHRFMHQLPVFGGGYYRLSVYDAGGRLASETAGDIGDEPAITIFNHTKTAMPLPANPSFDLKKYPFSNTMQVQAGTVQGYSAALQVVLAQTEPDPAAALPPLPWDPYLFVYNTKQEVHLVQPGRLDNTQVVNNTYDPGNPMLGFDLPLANVFRDGWKWPQEFLGIWRVYPSYVDYATTSGFKAASWWDTTQAPVNLDFAWHATGNLLNAAGMLWTDATSSRYYAAPLIADLDGDGTQEIMIGNLVRWQLEVYNADGTLRPGWPQVLKAEVKAAAAVGELDGDGKMEVVVGDTRGYLHAFHHDGQPLPGWPIKTGPADANYRILARPALADLTGDGRPEVILALSDGKLYVYGADGGLLPGWPVSIGDAADTYGNHVFDSSPVVADLDGDGQLEIVVGAYDKHAYAYHANGTLAWTFATGDVVLATPAVGDIDPGRPGLETVIASGDRFIYLLDKDGQQIWKRPTGWIIRSSPLVTDIDHDGALELVVGSDDHKVWAWHGDGSLVAGWPQTTGAAVASSPVAADVDGDGQAEIVVGSDDAKLYAWKADGSLVGGWPMDVDYPIKGAPAVGNLDGDAAVEVIGAGFDGRLKYSGMVPAVGAAHSVYLPIMKRP